MYICMHMYIPIYDCNAELYISMHALLIIIIILLYIASFYIARTIIVFL